ncbi:FG-GAP repeat domain-containing protein, partial [Algoriphagus sp.]|uniref:FG-GAP repeat domain-containing protein n=1 Tax=Algoriphagus sp. TaxID=1872435 RepID=UPI00391A30F9
MNSFYGDERFRIQNNGLVDLICAETVTFNPNFNIRRAAWASEEEVNTFGTPIVGDIDNDGEVEVLILYKTETGRRLTNIVDNNEWKMPTFNPGAETEYVTRGIAVYNYNSDGAGGLVLKKIIPTPDLNFESPTPFAIARVPGYANPLIIVATSSTIASDPADLDYADRQKLSSRLIAYDHTSTDIFFPKWISSEKYGANVPASQNGRTYASGGTPGIANFDLTSNTIHPSVYIYNEIFTLDPSRTNLANPDAGDNKVFDGGKLPDWNPDRGQGISWITPGGKSSFGGTVSVSVAADVIPGNNTLELICGNTVYQFNPDFSPLPTIQLRIPMANGELTPDGLTSVANIDLYNNRLDIVVTTGRTDVPNSRLVYVWTIEPGGVPKLIAQKTFNDTGLPFDFDSFNRNTGLAFIGDIDGNGDSEIGVVTPFKISMLNYVNGNTTLVEKWTRATDDESGHTLLTMFDFDQDGSQELVYRDEKTLRILNGLGIDRVPPQTVWGATGGEGPVIADFNGDGEADIIVTDSQDRPYNTGRYPADPKARLVVFKSNGNKWAPARTVWNQYAYFSFHVNEDLTIPKPQLDHGREQDYFFPTYDASGCLIADRRPFNSFLVQRTLYTEDGCFSSGIPAMDAKILLEEAKLLCVDPSGSNVIEFKVTVKNEGEGPMPDDTQIKFSFGAATEIETIPISALPDYNGPLQFGQSFISTYKIITSVNPADGDPLVAEINPDINGFRYEECVYDPPFDIPLIPRPVFTITPPPAICEGDGSILIEVGNNVSNLLIGDEVSWFQGSPTGPIISNGPGPGGSTFTILPDFSLQIDDLPASATPYLFYFKDVCSNLPPVEIEVNVDPAPNITVLEFAAVCFGETSGRIEIGDHQPYITYSLDGGTTVLTHDQLLIQRFASGNYTLTAIASLNPGAACVADFPFEIEEPLAITLTNKDVTPPSCDLPNGEYSIDFEGGVAPFVVSLSLAGTTIETLPNQSAGNYTKTNLAPGSYTFTVTDTNNCTISDLFELTNDPKLPINIILADQEFCEGEDAILIPIIDTGGNPRIITWYYDLLGANPISAGPDPINSNIRYDFDGEGIVISGLPAGAAKEFYVGVSGDLYCSVIEPVSISVLPPLVVSITATEIICFGDVVDITATATGGDGNFMYSLNSGTAQSSNIFTGLPAGDYTVTVTSAQNCNATSNTITVDSPPAAISLQGDPTIIGASCNESNGIIQNVNVTGGWGNYTIEWRKDNPNTGALLGNQLPEITGLAAGNYFLVVSDEKGCVEVFPFTVDPLPLPDLVIVDQAVCEGEDVTFTPVQTVSGASPTELIWYKDAAATTLLAPGADLGNPSIIYSISDESVLLIEGLPAGTHSFYLKVECTGDIKQATVVVSAAPNPIFEKTDVLCFGLPTGKIKVISNGNPDFRYSVDGGVPITQTELEALNFAVGTYKISISQQGIDCVTISDDIVIEQPEELIFTEISQKSPACGEDDGEIEFEIAGGVEDYTITINNQPLTAFQVSKTNNIYLVTALSLGQYDIRITDANGCEVTGQFTLVEDNTNAVQSNNLDVVFCEGEVVLLVPEITITGTVTPTFAWYFDAGLTQPIASNFSPTGTGLMYQIDPANGQLSVYNLALGDVTYYLEVTDAAICAVSSRADVSVIASPNPVFEKVDILCFGETTGKIRVSGNSNPNYRYSVNGSAPINQAALEALVFAAGTYTIEITEVGSDCSTTEEVILTQPEELLFDKISQKSP